MWNRIIVDKDPKGGFVCHVMSSTHSQKSRAAVVYHKKKFLVRHNALADDIPAGIFFKAFGIETDQARTFKLPFSF
jgi:DNA-directed RNA polymerase beta subunit